MVSQLQILNKVLQNKDFSLISMNNLTSEHFFQYQNEFNFILCNRIKIHYCMSSSGRTCKEIKNNVATIGVSQHINGIFDSI